MPNMTCYTHVITYTQVITYYLYILTYICANIFFVFYIK